MEENTSSFYIIYDSFVILFLNITENNINDSRTNECTRIIYKNVKRLGGRFNLYK